MVNGPAIEGGRRTAGGPETKSERLLARGYVVITRHLFEFLFEEVGGGERGREAVLGGGGDDEFRRRKAVLFCDRRDRQAPSVLSAHTSHTQLCCSRHRLGQPACSTHSTRSTRIDKRTNHSEFSLIPFWLQQCDCGEEEGSARRGPGCLAPAAGNACGPPKTPSRGAGTGGGPVSQ